MLQSWSRGTLQKSSNFSGYLSYKNKETKAFAIALHLLPLKWSLLRNVLGSSLQTQRVQWTPLSTLPGRWRDDAEPVLGALQRCSQEGGTSCGLSDGQPFFLFIILAPQTTVTAKKIGGHQGSTKRTVRKEWWQKVSLNSLLRKGHSTLSEVKNS